MDPVNNLSPILAALRRQVAENVQRLRKSGKLASAEGARTASNAAAGLEGTLRQKIKGLDRNTGAGKVQATRAFVEVVLAAEFGDALLSDPAVGDLLAELSASLRADPEVRGSIDQMLDGL